MNILLKIFVCFSFAAAAHAAVWLAEGFEDAASLSDWAIINNSTPGGQTPEGWFQGTGVFSAQGGSPDSYLQANFENAGDPGDISTWLLTPMLSLQPYAMLSFHTIGEDVPGFPDRLEVRLSTSGASTDTGSSPFSTGDFTELLLSINSDLSDDGYPTAWTEYTYRFSGLTTPVDARIGFRYFVPDRSVNASTIGIDSVQIVPEPSAGALTGLGLLVPGLFVYLRRRERSHS